MSLDNKSNLTYDYVIGLFNELRSEFKKCGEKLGGFIGFSPPRD